MAEYVSIAIDGPSSSGKSTVADAVALKTGFLHLNTGSMYRTVAYYCLKNGIDYDNEELVESFLDKINIEIKYVDGHQADFLNGEFVTPFLRTNEISVASSVVSQYDKVRQMAVRIQRDVASKMNVIMEGRDIGTVVLPNSKNKFFLTATSEERTKRRYKENLEKGIPTDYETLLKEVKERDVRDTTRAHSPLKQAEDAIKIDSTNKTIDEVVEIIIKNLKK